MSTQDSQSQLREVAQKLASGSAAYATTSSLMTAHMPNYTAAVGAIATQFGQTRDLAASTSKILSTIAAASALSPGVQSVLAANASLASTAERFALPQLLASKASAHQFPGINVTARTELASTVATALGRLGSTSMLSASLVAQLNLAKLDTSSIGRLAGFSPSLQVSRANALDRFTKSFESLAAVGTLSHLPAPRVPLLSAYPPVEYYREVQVLESITPGDTSDLDLSGETDLAVATAIGEVLPHADILLEDFNPALSALLRGAHDSLVSDNPDRARHVTTSLRELLTSVINTLAPDAQVRLWVDHRDSPPKGLLHDGRPTRRARLLFICKDVNSAPLDRFVQDDVRAVLSLLESLNSGTHVVTSRLTPVQLEALTARVESQLVFLLQLRRAN